MNYFIYASTAIFIFLALILNAFVLICAKAFVDCIMQRDDPASDPPWNNKTWPNVLLKALFLFMSVAGIILSLTALGYMVRVIK